MTAPRAVRAALAPGAAVDLDAVVVQPEPDVTGTVLLDGRRTEAALVWLDAERAVIVRTSAGPARQRVLLLPPGRAKGAPRGVLRREVVIDGWRVEVDVEPSDRATLRERAQRGRTGEAHGGPMEVRAMIPGVVVAIRVIAGDPVTVGQPLVVVEAMKMENELRATRAGTVARVAVGPGQTVELGDLLLVIAAPGTEDA